MRMHVYAWKLGRKIILDMPRGGGIGETWMRERRRMEKKKIKMERKKISL